MTLTTVSTRIRRTLVAGSAAALLTASGAAVLAAGPAAASASGFSDVQRCTAAAGHTTWTPGLTGTARNQSGLLSATIDGCSSLQTGAAEPGQGSLTAVLNGKSSTKAVTASGTFTLNWPVSSGLNPSNGTLTVSGPVNGIYTVSGSVTSGAYVGALLRTSYLVTGVNTGAKGTIAHPITSQQFTNTASLELLRNFG